MICPHLGHPTGELINCPTCAGNVSVKLFSCDLHSQCSTHKHLPGYAHCPTCVDNPHRITAKSMMAGGIGTTTHLSGCLLCCQVGQVFSCASGQCSGIPQNLYYHFRDIASFSSGTNCPLSGVISLVHVEHLSEPLVGGQGWEMLSGQQNFSGIDSNIQVFCGTPGFMGVALDLPFTDLSYFISMASGQGLTCANSGLPFEIKFISGTGAGAGPWVNVFFDNVHDQNCGYNTVYISASGPGS